MNEATFDLMAAAYDLHRPGYPAAAVDAILRCGGLTSVSRVLEVGAGSGKATRHFLERGVPMDCVEPGQALADRGNRLLGPRGARFTVSRFEDFDGEDGAYDAIVSAQAFHWVAQPEGYAQCLRLLKPGGTLALLWNLDLFSNSESDLALWRVLEEHDGFVSCMRQGDYPARQERIAGEIARRFAPPEVRHFTHEVRYTPESYHRYLLTSHVFIRQEERLRARCLDALHALVSRYPDALRRRYTCEVYLANKPR